jgi:hypothetical protein
MHYHEPLLNKASDMVFDLMGAMLAILVSRLTAHGPFKNL